MLDEVYKDEHDGLKEFLDYNNIKCETTENELRNKRSIWKKLHPSDSKGDDVSERYKLRILSSPDTRDGGSRQSNDRDRKP
jgi:hypothetical protein